MATDLLQPTDLLADQGPVDLLDKRSFWEKTRDLHLAPTETALTVATSLGGLLPSGLAGIATGVANAVGLTEKDPADVVNQWREGITYGVGWGRTTPESKAVTEFVSWPFEKWHEYVAKPAGKKAQDYVLDLDPEEIPDLGMRMAFEEQRERDAGAGGAAGIETAVDLAPWVFGPKAVKSVASKVKVPESLSTAVEAVKEIFAPISTGSQKARAEVKTYSNAIRESAAMRNREMLILDKRFNRKQQEKMGDALAQEEVSFAKPHLDVTPQKLNLILDREGIVDVAKTTQNLPDVPSGQTRLYRASSPTVKHKDVWKPGTYQKSNPKKLPGKFYTPDLKYADYYRETYGKDASISYVDVPTRILSGKESPTMPGEFILDIENIKIPVTTSRGIDSLSMNEKTAVIELVARHKSIAEKAVELGIIPISKDFYFPRKAIQALGLESAKRIYGSRQVKTATVHAKKRKYETIEETEAAIMARLGEDSSINRNIKVLPLVTAELERAISGKLLIKSIREYGTQIGIDTVKYGSEDAAYFTLPHPAFREYRPQLKRRAEGDLGPQGGQWKIVKDGDGNVVFFPDQIKIHRDFEGPMKAALDNAAGPTYQALMQLKSKSMSLIMFSPLMHGQVIWGKVLPFQFTRTLTLKNYRDGHKIQNIKGKPQNEAWIRDQSKGEFSGADQAMRQAIKDGYVPIESMGWMQRMTDVIGTPSLDAGRSVTAKVVGVIAKPFGKKTEAMRGVDWLGGMWHDTLLWSQIRAMGYGLWFNLRNQAIKKGLPPEVAGAQAAHMANRFTGSIPFEDISSGVRNLANIMLFSKSFTGTNLGLYKDALKGLPKAVESRIIESGGSIAGIKQANSTIKRAASAALVKDIAFVYVLNSMLQNAVQLWKADNKEEAFNDIIDQYDANAERYMELAQNPAAAVFNLDELAAGSINDPGKEDRVYIGKKPDGTAIYARSPLGKVGEDLLKAVTSPIELGWNKLSPTVGFIAGVALNDKSKQRDFDIDVYDPEGSTLENVRDIFYYFLEAHTPSDYAESIVSAASGDKDAVAKWQAMLQPLGISFSKGSPGGPALGTIYKKEEAYRRAIRRHGPEIKRLIENGDFDSAIQETIKAGMRPQEISAFLKRRVFPNISENQISDFMQIADEVERKRLMDQFEFFYGPEQDAQ